MPTDTADFGTLVTRLEVLERQNRRLKRTGVVVLLLLAALFLMGQAPPKRRTIEAERFVIIDDKGKTRAELTTSDLVFYAQDGKEQMTLDADHLAFFDPVQPQGTQARIFLQVLKGEPTLWVSNKYGKIIWSVP